MDMEVEVEEEAEEEVAAIGMTAEREWTEMVEVREEAPASTRTEEAEEEEVRENDLLHI